VILSLKNFPHAAGIFSMESYVLSFGFIGNPLWKKEWWILSYRTKEKSSIFCEFP